MIQTVVPMLRVSDVKATVAWYKSIGFETRSTHEEDGCGMDWASLSFGGSEIMLTAGGAPVTTPRREVDLYIRTAHLNKLHRQIASKVEIVEDIHDTFYGMREFIVRDLNGFWITFGQAIAK